MFIQIKVIVNDDLMENSVDKTLDHYFENQYADWVIFIQNILNENKIKKITKIITQDEIKQHCQYIEILDENVLVTFQEKINQLSLNEKVNVTLTLMENIPEEHSEFLEEFELGIVEEHAANNDTSNFTNTEENKQQS